MSSQEQIPAGAAPPRAAGLKGPNCPQCQRAMTVKLVTPVMFASELDDIVFGCEPCGTEAKRTVKRS